LNIILASASPRRQELLHRLTDDFTVKISDFDEYKIPYKGSPSEYVVTIAEGKAAEVATKVERGIVIGCDTIVALDQEVLGKPSSEKEAFKMLQQLSGRVHQVYSGIALINVKTKRVLKDYVKTEVKFDRISEREIMQYIKTGEPMDKAGAYGIQGYAGAFVEEIRGCYYNVMGLPLNKCLKMLREMGANL
jgi:septum formation protein